MANSTCRNRALGVSRPLRIVSSQSGDPDEAATGEEHGPHEGEHEIELGEVARDGHDKADPSQFELLKVLGEGSFGKVFLVRKVVGADAGTLYAMKVLKKATLRVRDRYRTKTERNILVDVEHPFIVKLHYAFQTAGKLYLILDFLRGGDLFSRLSKERSMSEPEAAAIIKTLATTLAYLHENGVVHRDLKPANILFASEDRTADSVTICDMGFAKQVSENGLLMTPCYTLHYVAPEVLKRQGYDAACDIWSLGVILYIMLSGRCPFSTASTDSQEILQRIGSGKLDLQVNLPPLTIFSFFLNQSNRAGRSLNTRTLRLL
ncbi:unnamed protein product [Acanthoscelides obtectus]|uniref:Protein kinase domain-containing protein n=1 Tax=Acanthoscelides obtectus TaxID=200917 RepID=A0A9P0JK61_ACAOB|nr:unnamed protein product [Acanthoscelides obtectus]CAK1678797.1 Ribosomal protein S6 kinase alpha-3 [Acanthoscelides obtectus]